MAQLEQGSIGPQDNNWDQIRSVLQSLSRRLTDVELKIRVLQDTVSALQDTVQNVTMRVRSSG